MLVFSERYSSTKTPLLPCLRGINYYYDLTDYQGGDVDNKLSDNTKLNVYGGITVNNSLQLTGGYRDSFAQLTTPITHEEPIVFYGVMSLTDVWPPNYMATIGERDNSDDAIGIARESGYGSRVYPVPFTHSYSSSFSPIQKNMYETFIVLCISIDPDNSMTYCYAYDTDGIGKISLPCSYEHDGKVYLGTHKAKTTKCTTLWRAAAAGSAVHTDSEVEINMAYLYQKYCT